MDAAGFELDFPTLVLQIGYEVNVGQGTARVGYKYRQGKEPGSNCTLFPSNGTLASRERAIMDFDYGLPPPIGFSPVRLWFVSNNPDKYIFEFGCHDRNQVINGVCYYRWYINIILREGQLDNPPMRELVWELWQKFGLKFDDPRNTFLWVGYECPDDVLP
ncbi:uncharacterized protein LOC128216650 [Mya arenaria]|uniref:uncharacterized protein LOC128216650 n=1 Tax=Mya arenaria TaxID=6604 RepID=UPI0022E9799C|nr:uncharacterized protein LOC128216650 [Mya arenaria]